jgi:hypothetical protein
MASSKATRPAPAVTGREPRGDLLPGRIKPNSPNTLRVQPSTAALHERTAGRLCGEVFGDDTAIAGGIKARSSSPILLLCRLLISAGIPDQASLDVFRGYTLAVKVRSLREGARLEINGHGTGLKLVSARGASPVVRSGPDFDQTEGGRP